MADHNNGFSFRRQLLDHICQLLYQETVHTQGRLIQNDHIRTGKQYGKDRQHVLFPHRQIQGEGFPILFQMIRLQHLRQLFFRKRHLLHTGTEGKLPFHGLLKKHMLRMLEHQDDILGNLGNRLFDNGFPFIAHIPFRGLVQAVQMLYKGGFS